MEATLVTTGKTCRNVANARLKGNVGTTVQFLSEQGG